MATVLAHQHAHRQDDRPLDDVGEALAHVAARALVAADPGPVGLELEAHLVDRHTPGARVPWARITRLVAGLAPLPGGSRVTLEPGGQVELSGPPYGDVAAAVAALRTDSAALARALAADGLALAALGTDPLRPASRVSPGPRYLAMEQHFAAIGCPGAGAAMMTSTASLQVNLEAGPAAGWVDRVGLAHALGPVLVAVSACSPWLQGRDTGWVSGRQQVWGDLDQARCGPLLGRGDPADEWAEYALAAPVMLVRFTDAGGAEPVTGPVSFADWVRGRPELGGRRPTAADLDYHLTTLFPPVRLRGFLEVRYLDAAPEPWWPALAAVTATLLDDPVAADLAAAACAPVAGRWDDAAHHGLTDPDLHTAATACLAAVADRVPPALRPEVHALAELVAAGRSPGDAVADTARAAGPAAALLAACPEEDS
ncbi:ergothioneine biosynthesis glutamate--cysteine ligase EgtA [Modestobacter sp. Leaf380]|uniref:ergothioneine biosynthesis glutamate--cysteine ligase EgtA n=1 Tax=Modestobacter sp. Leaf380 TaxID=1736356 RepID=UPI0006F42E16|nr:ergothioneine biosynthesis glutamate--cysteine ligase EgtA [Modestobacter sp. Leaf380]KQS71891.1 ergothioneine biosynthesis glutamate--cysteine ligase EgtA [Modestobacter sp. Leaf380]